MKLIDMIHEAGKSISEDIEVSKARSKKDRKENPANYIGNRSTPESVAWTNLFIPHLIGIFIGIAVARLFNSEPFGYAMFSIIFAFLAGTYKSHEFDKISWKYAFIKNALLMCVWLAVFAGWLIIFYFRIN